MTSPRRHLLPTGIALAAVLMIAGCATATPNGPAPAEPAAPTTTAPEGVGSEQPAPDGAEAALPDSYPLDAVPLVDGFVVSAADAGVLWNVVIRPDAEASAAADEAERLLTGVGMVLLTRVDENRAYRSDEFDVNVNVHDDGTLSYTVRPR